MMDARCQSDSYKRCKYTDYLSLIWIKKCRRAYIVGDARDNDENTLKYDTNVINPMVSPCCASTDQLTKLPPLLVIAGYSECLVDDIRKFVKLTQTANHHHNQTEEKIQYIEGEPGMAHIYPYGAFVPSSISNDVFTKITQFIIDSCQ